ncbi:MAG TPA: ABC transporter permease, partial [Vicinamibacterales bacterium]|nr:ABC transporter permease [Vicinamibacterales bacterium]
GGIDLSSGAVIGLTSVVIGYFFVQAEWPLFASAVMGLMVGLGAGLASSWLIVGMRLPPFIATLGVMGIWRGAGYIITEARFYDLSARLPRNWTVLGVSIDWVPPLVMVLLAAVFQVLMRRFQWGRAIFAVGGNEMAALFSGLRVGLVKTTAYVVAGLLASISGVVLAVVQGQGKADLANGYELDIIASAVVGGTSLTGGRGSVAGAVLGALIFGVLRNALPQIPGATFYDRVIVGIAVIGIVVMDQILVRKT